MKKKPKIAIFSLTACEGCQVSLIDQGVTFINFLETVDLIDCSLIEEKPFPKGKVSIDIAFVEGIPIRKEQIGLLKKVRKISKILVAMGNCAALGGIPEMKNYQGKKNTIRFIYKHSKGIENPDIKEIDNFVKVDAVIPGCPINAAEFLRITREIIEGKDINPAVVPVCSECVLKGTPRCFLARKKICLGMITQAGCGAVCAKSDVACLGCRGVLKGANMESFFKVLERFSDKEDIDDELEIFGIKDDIEKLKKKKQ